MYVHVVRTEQADGASVPGAVARQNPIQNVSIHDEREGAFVTAQGLATAMVKGPVALTTPRA